MIQDKIAEKIEQIGLELPPAFKVPKDIILPFSWVKLRGQRAIFSGHLPQKQNGELIELRGKVGIDLTLEQGYEAARALALSVLGSLKTTLGSLDRIQSWVRVFGMVNCDSNFAKHPLVINGFSDLILELFGPDIGQHARSAVGMNSLPFGMPVEIEGEVEIDSI